MNPYDICVTNRIVQGKQHTITWHVDDVKSSHVDPKVNDDFYEWCVKMYGEIGEVKNVRGKKHDYLAMILDYSEKGKLKVDMKYYIKAMVDDFPLDFGERQTTAPWNDKLFKVIEKEKKLNEKERKIFHTFVMKSMFLCKRARPDISPGINFFQEESKNQILVIGINL